MLHYNRDKIIDIIEKYFNFDNDDYLTDSNFFDFFKDSTEDCLIPGFSYSYGATKLCLIPTDDSDYVIKIPFIADSSGEVFFGANNNQNDWDYCLTEVEIYNRALEEGLSFLFAETHLLYSKNNFNFYIQQRCTLEEDINPYETFNISYKEATPYLNRVAELTHCFHFGISATYLALVYRTYGEVVGDAFFKFLSDRGITDLHSGNCGYNLNYKPVLVDFSSYNEYSYDDSEVESF